MAKTFAQQVLAPIANQLDNDKHFPHAPLGQLKTMGFYGLCLPQDFGGLALSYREYAQVIQALSMGCASTAITVAVTNMVATIVHKHAKPSILATLQNRYQDKTSAPLLSFAITEPQAGSDAQGINSSYRQTADGFILNGHKCFITSGAHADYYLVTARDEANHACKSAFLLSRQNPGLRIGKEEVKMGLRASSTVQLFFDQIQLTHEQLLGNIGDGFKIAMGALTGGRIGVAAQSLGIAQAALDYCQPHLSNILKSQGNYWKWVDLNLLLEAGLELIYDAARLQDEQDPLVQVRSSVAKLYCSETANQVVHELMQLWGDAAYRDATLSRHWRDVRVTTIYEGTSEIQRLVIARALLKQNGEML